MNTDIQPLLNTLFNKNNINKDVDGKNNFFRVIVLIVLTCFILTYMFPSHYGFIVTLLLFAILIANNYIIYNSKDVFNRNKMIMYHLNTLQEITNTYIDQKLINKNVNLISNLTQKEIKEIYNRNKLDSLYIDSNMIEFLYSIKKLAEWDLPSFYLLLKGVNNILKLENEIEVYYEESGKYPENIYQMFEQTLLLRSNTINNVHTFIYNIPKLNVLYDYLDKIINRYMILISRHTDKIYCYVQNHIKIIGINNETKFITYNTIKPYDKREIDYFV